MADIIKELEFRGVDDWNRPVFKVVGKQEYYGSTMHLFDYSDGKQMILLFFKDKLDQLEYFGRTFNCEPHGGRHLDLILKYTATIEMDLALRIPKIKNVDTVESRIDTILCTLLQEAGKDDENNVRLTIDLIKQTLVLGENTRNINISRLAVLTPKENRDRINKLFKAII